MRRAPALPLALLALLAAAVLSACRSPAARTPAPADLVVSVAASLAGAVREAQPLFEAAQPGHRLRLNIGSSGALAAQIGKGAPVDLFLSAGPAPVQELERAGLVEPGSVQTVATNRLILVRPASGPGTGPVAAWADLAGPHVRRIAIANPQHVPAGQYAREVLTGLGLWEQVQSRLILGEDVRQVLTYAEAGEVDAAIVYASDVAAGAGRSKVTVVAPAPASAHSPITYPGAVIRGGKNPAGARLFLEFLRSPRGREILTKHGFGEGSR